MFVPRKIQRIDTPKGRLYETEKGDVYPSVTTVLGAYENEQLKKWIESVGIEKATEIKEEAGLRGQKLHNCLEQRLRGEEVILPMDIYVRGMYRGISRYLDKSLGKIYGIELQMWSDALRMAGTADLIAEWDGELAIVDYKNSRRYKRSTDIQSYWAQTSAYSIMVEELYGVKCRKLVILMATTTGQTMCYVERRSKKYLIHLSECLTKFKENYDHR